MSAKKSSVAVDLDTLQNRFDDLVRQSLADPTSSPENGAAGARALNVATNGSGPAGPGNGRENVELPAEQQPGLPVPRLGAEAASNMAKLSKAAAEDIRQLGRLALQAGKRVQEECEQMACDVEANGGTVALHLTGLSQLLADVGMSNRETLHRLLGGVSASIVPSAGDGHVSEEPAAPAKTNGRAPLGRVSRRPD
jgi:hypothetical protein